MGKTNICEATLFLRKVGTHSGTFTKTGTLTCFSGSFSRLKTWSLKTLKYILKVEKNASQHCKIILYYSLNSGSWVSNSLAWSTSQDFSLGATSLLGLQLMGKWNTLPFACIYTRVFEYANFSIMYVIFIHGVISVWAMPTCIFTSYVFCRKARVLSRVLCHLGLLLSPYNWGYIFWENETPWHLHAFTHAF